MENPSGGLGYPAERRIVSGRIRDRKFAGQLAAQDAERRRRADLARRVDAAALEARVAERAGVRPSAVPERPVPRGRDLPPTDKQLGLLRALARETGTTFTYPQTRGEAMDEIARMKPLAKGRRVRKRGRKRGRKRSRARRGPRAIH
jgi:hypothetical protein